MQHSIRVPRLVVAGTHSGAGKTTIATALMAALRRRGLRVQPFKAGPDFVDPTFHRAATGRFSRNLDGWMLSREANLDIFARAAADADIAVVEGVMGLFDGYDGASDAGSTAQLAKWLRAPVLLILDASAMARSAAAIVRGFEDFDPELNLAGVVLNRVAGKGHFEYLETAIAQNCRALPLGFAAEKPAIAFPDRHLGLVMAGEFLTAEKLDQLSSWLATSLDLEKVTALASTAPALSIDLPGAPAAPKTARIGVARDRAFCFYYQDNLDILALHGCELIEFSPLADPHLPPDLGGLYLGGGYPELHAPALSQNHSMLDSIRDFIKRGAPVYAECGGFMYLTEAIIDAEGRSHPVAGIFPTRARMQNRLAALGYAEIEQTSNRAWLRLGERARGHEFRFSSIDEMPPEVARNFRIGARAEGFVIGSVLASYVHLHFASCPEFAARFAAACSQTNL